MIIRQALKHDIEELAQFNINMARETEGLELIPEVIKAGVRGMIENPQMGYYLVIELDNQIQASLMVTHEWSDWRNGIFWWIQSVYVREGYRGQGLYRALYERVRELAEQQSAVCGFRLYVERNNLVAQKTYEALGMQQTDYKIYEQLSEDLEYRRQ